MKEQIMRTEDKNSVIGLLGDMRGGHFHFHSWLLKYVYIGLLVKAYIVPIGQHPTPQEVVS